MAICCLTKGGEETSQRNLQCWEEALTEARRHKDILLEADTSYEMGNVAKKYR